MDGVTIISALVFFALLVVLIHKVSGIERALAKAPRVEMRFPDPAVIAPKDSPVKEKDKSVTIMSEARDARILAEAEEE